MKKLLAFVSPYILSLRPYQWVKNVIVFSGLIFSTSLLKIDTIGLSLSAFIVFCIASSSIYILNDLRDVELDRMHPTKKDRVIASGKVSIKSARILMVLLMPSAILFAYFLDRTFCILIISYLILNIAYSFGLKKVVILDALIVASGFLLRALAGCSVIHVDVSPWLFICTLSLALVISFGKRRNELNTLKNEAKKHRETLELYNIQILDIILTISSATAIGTYSLYTMASETVTRFGSQWLIITTPFVMYGLFRYLFLIYTQNTGGDPTRLLVKDIPSLVNSTLWVTCILIIIYGSRLSQIM